MKCDPSGCGGGSVRSVDGAVGLLAVWRAVKARHDCHDDGADGEADDR